ncbi:MAG: signal peptidase I [Halovenus sp.]
MGLRHYAWVAIQVVAVVVVIALIVGQVLGQPLLLSYVSSGSMEPTMSAGDGFVALPPAIAGSVGVGDVVVYEAQQVEGGGLTTHRVVDETERGFITRGDANPFTDQDSGEPPVQNAEIVAVAWQPTGSVLTIPHLGTVVEGIQSVLASLQRLLAQVFGTTALLGSQGLGYLLFGLSIALYLLLGWLEDDRRRDRERSRDTGTDTRVIALGLALLVMSGATAAMVIPGGTQEYGIVSAEFDSDNPTTIRQGTSDTLPYTVGNGGFVPTVVFLEPGGDDVAAEPSQMTVPGGGIANATVTITTPPETGFYRYFVTEHRYLQLLPPSVIAALYEIHPWLPLLAINALVGLPFYLLTIVLLGRGRIRDRSRTDPSGGILSRFT